MTTWAVVVVAVAVLAVLKPVWDSYRYQKRVEGQRRYADIGATCAAEAGFVMDNYSDGLWGDFPSYTFKHRSFPDLTLSIYGDRWIIREFTLTGLGLRTALPEPNFKEQRGQQLSVADFRDIAQEYQAVVEWRRRAAGWGCLADLRQHGAEIHD